MLRRSFQLLLKRLFLVGLITAISEVNLLVVREVINMVNVQATARDLAIGANQDTKLTQSQLCLLLTLRVV